MVFFVKTTVYRMARNSEKRLGGLNRFLEAKQKKEKGPGRPPLYKLATADEVKKWIPSITKEIEYLLQQISSTSRNYQEKTIDGFKLRVDDLKKEHQRFVAKVQSLDPAYKDVIPWEPRGYRRKRPRGHFSLPEVSDSELCSTQRTLPECGVDGNRNTTKTADTRTTAVFEGTSTAERLGDHTDNGGGDLVHAQQGAVVTMLEGGGQGRSRDIENVLHLDYSSSSSEDGIEPNSTMPPKYPRTDDEKDRNT